MSIVVNKAQIGEIDDHMLIDVEVCGVCGGKLELLEDYLSENSISFAQCKRCGAITYNRIASQQYLDHMYSNYDKAYGYYNGDSTDAVTFAEPERMARHIFKYVKQYSQHELPGENELRILDFGGGSGAMGYLLADLYCRNHGCTHATVTVVDYLDALYKTDDARIQMKRVYPIQKLTEAEFDIIIASAIIEHLPKPADEMNILFSLLRKGGFLYCRMPYAYPLHRLLRRFGIMYDMLYPGHIWDFAPEWYHYISGFFSKEDRTISLILSRPSIPETTFKGHFIRALITNLLKAPWFICHRWPFVGGWEAIYRRG